MMQPATCPVCGRTTLAVRGRLSCCTPGSRPKPPKRDDCVHRGAELRRQECPTCCGGKTDIKVFACAVHCECSIRTRLVGVAGCCDSRCGDYVATSPPAAAPAASSEPPAG